MKRVLWVLAAIALGCVLTATAADKADSYLKDGKLTQTLEVNDVQGGFAGFTGKQWVVEPSGEWRISSVFNKRLTVEKKGTLTKEQMGALAKDLAKYDLAGLAGKTEGKVMVNPHVVTIKFGKDEATLNLPAGEALPKAGADTVSGRFSGIAGVVSELLKEPKKEK